MANEKELKKITLHPIIDGKQKENIDLLSKTSVNNILSGSIDTGGDTPFDAGFTKDLKYEQIIKQEEIPVIPEDGDECTLPTTYNLDDFTFDPTDDEIIYNYNSIEDEIRIGLTADAPTPGAIFVNTSDTTYLYMNYTNGKCWYYMPARSNNLVIGDTVGKPLAALVPTPYEGIISFNFDSSALQEGKELIFDKILGLNPQIIEVPVERTIEEKNADIKNWEYDKETKIKPLVEHQKYNLKNNLNSVKMIEIINNGSESYDYSSSIWSIDGHIIYTGLKAISEWTVLNKQTNRWEKLNVTFVNETRNVKCGILSSYQIIYYNNKVYAARANTYNDKDEYLADLRFENYIYEITFDANTNTLTLTRHNLDLDGNSIYTCYVFEWDNKLLCKVYDKEDTSNNDIYELDLTNYTTTLTEYNLLGYTYDSNTGYKQSLDRLNNIGNLVYNYPGDKWTHPIGNIVLAGSYNHNDCSKIRHTVADDQNYLADQTIVLNEYSIIIERVNENNQKAGLTYIPSSEMGYIQDANGDSVLCAQNNYSDSQTSSITTKYFIFNEGSNLFEEIGYQIDASIGNNKIGFNNVFYVNGVCYSYYAYYKTLIKQTSFENNTMIFGEDTTNIPINGLIYCNSEANENEVFSIGVRYNYDTDNHCLCLNDTYYYETGTKWLDNLGNVADVSNLQILYDENNFNAVYPKEAIEAIADFTYIETTTLDQKVNEPLANKLYQVVEEEIEVPNELEDGESYHFKENMKFSEKDAEIIFPLQDGALIYEDNDYTITYSMNSNTHVASLVLSDSSQNTYSYIIYADEAFRNIWLEDMSDFQLTVSLEGIVNKIIFDRMIELGTHIEVKYKDQTLEEKNADLQNWTYDTKAGLYDIPKWDEMPAEDFDDEIYADSTTYTRIIVNISADKLAVNKSISINIGNTFETVKMYSISNTPGYDQGTSFKANTWYMRAPSLPDVVECETPDIVLDETKLNDPDFKILFDAIYGTTPIALKEKFAELDGPLKDKIYEEVTGDLVENQTYSLNDDYTEFFEKYGKGQSTLIYSANGGASSDPGSGGYIDMPALDGRSVSGTKGGGSAQLDPGINPGTPVIGKASYITEIYLYTDSTPGGVTPIKDGEFMAKDIQYVDGAEPAVPGRLGGAVLDVRDSNYDTYSFYQGASSWVYNGAEVPLENMPQLILNSSSILNEEMLKAVLNTPKKSITLKEKFDEVESGELKDKIYEKGDIIQVMNPIYEVANNAQSIYNILVNDMYKSKTEYYMYEDYENEIAISAEGGFYSGEYRLEINIYNKNMKYTCNMRKSDYYTWAQYATWSSYDQITEKEKSGLDKKDLPIQLAYNEDCISTSPYSYRDEIKEMFNLIMKIVDKDTSILLKDKVEGPIADNLYKVNQKEVTVEGDFENKKEYLIKTSDINLDASGRMSGETIAYEAYGTNAMLRYQDNSENVMCVGYYDGNDLYLFFNKEANEWQYYDGTSYTGPQLTFALDTNEYYNTSELREILLEVIDVPQTLEEKVNDLPNWTYNTIPATYTLKTPNWENIDISNVYYNFYQAGSYPFDYEENYCYLGRVDYAYEIETYETDGVYTVSFSKVIGFDNSSEPIFETYYNFNKDCIVGNGSTQELTKGIWYKGTYDELYDYNVFEEVANPEMLFHDFYINTNYKELFNSLVKYIPEEKISLDNKLNKLNVPLKNWTYDSYTKEEIIPYGYAPKFEMTLTKMIESPSSSSTTYIYGASGDTSKPSFAYVVYKSGNIENHKISYYNNNINYTFDVYGSGAYINSWEPSQGKIIKSQDDLAPFLYDETQVNPTYKAYFENIITEYFIHKETEVKIPLEEKLDSLVVTFDANIAVNAWENTTDVDIAAVYPYQAIIQHNALINAIKCDVEFGLTDMLNDNYAPFFSCNDITGEIAIFAKAIPSDPITVKITRWLGTKLDDIIVDHTIHNSI